MKKDRRHNQLRVLNEETLQERIDKEVAKLERKCRVQDYTVENYKSAKMWRYLKSLNRPVTYLDAADFIRDSGIHPGVAARGHIDIMWHAASRIHSLEKNGWLRRVGKGALSPYYKTVTHRRPNCYEISTPEKHERNKAALQKACDQMVANIELWHAQAHQIPNCMLDHLQPMKVRTARDWDILDARVSGQTLKEIGDRHGITRERVRQIVDKAIR